MRQGGILFSNFQFIAVSKHDKASIFQVIFKGFISLGLVNKMWQGVIDFLDVVGCNNLLQD